MNLSLNEFSVILMLYSVVDHTGKTNVLVQKRRKMFRDGAKRRHFNVLVCAKIKWLRKLKWEKDSVSCLFHFLVLKWTNIDVTVISVFDLFNRILLSFFLFAHYAEWSIAQSKSQGEFFKVFLAFRFSIYNKNRFVKWCCTPASRS